MGKIAAIVIKNNWEHSNVTYDSEGGLKPRNCADLQPLTVDDVRRYLQQAGRIAAAARDATTVDSVCVAHGTLTTRDGRRAEWSIGEEREATLD